MSDADLDRDTVERLLRGEPAGPPGLADLLTAASAGLAVDDPAGEEAAVAAFREARSHRSPRPIPRRLFALVSVKAALIGFLLALAGGVTVVTATTSQHLPGPLGDKHSQHGHTPKTSRTGLPPAPSPSPSLSPSPSPAPSHLAPERPGEHPATPAQPNKHPHPTKKPKGTREKTKHPSPPGLRGKSPHRTPGTK
jgi:hypothetical protein